MRTVLLPLRRAARAGFTLIELLAVIAIISILVVFLLPRVTEAFDAANVTACKTNMIEIHKGLILYKSSFNRIPGESGVRFFADLISSETLDNSKSAALRLTCPAVDKSSLAGIAGRPETEWYKDLSAIDGTYSSYAGRDMKNHPMRKYPGKAKDGAVVADDNDGGMNHSHTTVVLLADGSVQTYEMADLRKDGTLGQDEAVLVVGPESPLEALRTVSLD